MKLVSNNPSIITVYRLLTRDFHVIKKTIHDVIINNIVILGVLYILFGLLGPYINITKEQLPMIYIGFLVGNIIYVGFNQAIKDVFDLSGNRMIDYHLTLPLTRNWTIAHLILRYMLWLTFATLPSFVLCKLLLGPLLPLSNINWPATIVMYIMSMLFCAVLFLLTTFGASTEWFLFNIWQRLLWPMSALGCTMYTWKTTYQWSKPIGYTLLLNPQTYLNEGMRAALLPTINSLPVAVSIAALTLLNSLGIIWLTHLFKKRLDSL